MLSSTKRRSLLILLFITASSPGWGQAGKVSSNPHEDPTVKSQGQEIVVTGEPRGATPHVLADLGLNDFASKEMLEQCTFGSQGMQLFPEPKKMTTEDWTKFATRMKISDFKGKNVLSLGEGYSGFVPYLRAQGVKAYGVDLWYGDKSEIDPKARGAKMMEAYRKKFGAQGDNILVEGDATDLKTAKHKDFPEGIPADSMDAVFSRHLLGYLPLNGQKRMLEEAVRVTKPKGTIRIAHYLTNFEKSDAESQAFLDMLKQLAKDDKIEVRAYGAQSICAWKQGQFEEAMDLSGQEVVIPNRSDTFELQSFKDMMKKDKVGIAAPGIKSLLMMIEITKK